MQYSIPNITGYGGHAHTATQFRACCGRPCLRHAPHMSRRGATDSLNPVNEPRWLVIRDRYSRAIECRALEPKTNLRGVMEAERARRAAEGWSVDTIPKNCSFCFCDRDNERLCIAIECYEPGKAPMR